MKTRMTVTLIILLLAGVTAAVAVENLTLQQASQLAVEQNPAIRQSEINVERAERASEQADESETILDRLREEGLLTPDVEQLLDLLPAQAEQGEKMARLARDLVRNQVILEARQNYLEVQKARENKNLAKQNLQRAEEMVRLATVSYNHGMTPRSDVLGAEAQVAAAQAALLAAENQVELAALELNNTLGRRLDASLSVAELQSVPKPGRPNLESGLSSALKKRIEIEQAKGEVELQETQLEYVQENFSEEDAVHRQAELDLEEARLNLEITKKNVELQVRQLYSGMEVLKKQEQALEKSVKAAEESYRLACLRYEAGVTTQMEVTGAQTTLLELETQLLHVRYDRYLMYQQWLFATARDLD
ncbi:TolC family protein [Dethiobacter alkaliphilus]|uniref:Outer membrane efflux protein n=1 Tax=Dethiobacter alkaliphilus AHT 1 TaxID=555088 RepID=C0GIH3_DETAL|nr:TolC family protein [Dethiobacter alkaliphilus]EEG76834.1 outer membrane efflux protein [Dethiobacter alkaliphilus AHT 1]